MKNCVLIIMTGRTRPTMWPCVLGLHRGMLSLVSLRWLLVLFVCIVYTFCTVVTADLNRQGGIAGLGPKDDLEQKYPNLNKRGLLPGLLNAKKGGKHNNNAPRNRLRQPRDQLLGGKGVRHERDLNDNFQNQHQPPPGRVNKPFGDEIPKAPRPDKPKPRAPQEQPKVRYDKVLKKVSEETSYRFPENQRVYFTCPKDAFIAEISYKFDTVTSQLVRPWTWGSGTGGLFSIRHKYNKGLSPERETPTFLRQPIINNNNKRQQFLDMVNPVAQSPLTESGCDPVLYCLGHQACLFKVTVDLCANDPAAGKRKMFYISVRCAKDSALQTYLYQQEAVSLIKREMNQVLYITLDEEKTTKEFTQLTLRNFEEDEIFGIQCPPAKEAHKNG